MSAALPWLYLMGISTGNMSKAMSEDAKGLSVNVVRHLKTQWADEHASWSRRHLSKSRHVYWLVDDIHTGLRSENSDGHRLPVTTGVRPNGREARVAIGADISNRGVLAGLQGRVKAEIQATWLAETRAGA
jgi:putative transposase